MSHLHIPDGILPFFLPVLGFVITGLIIAFALYRLRDRDINKLIPRLGIVSAFIMVVMSVPLGLIPYHLNLTVLAGIILGPGLGFIAVFLVNLLLGLIGHGGLTMVGLNSLAVGSEVFLGYYLFRWLSRRIKLPVAAALTTMLALVVSSLMMISVVAASQVDPAVFVDRHATEAQSELPGLSVSRFAAMVLPVTLPGAVIESLAVFGIVGFLLRVRPDILGMSTDGNPRSGRVAESGREAESGPEKEDAETEETGV